MKKQNKATRIRKLILAGFRDVAIAKLVKCHANYVYIVRTKMAETMPMVKDKNKKEVDALLQRQVDAAKDTGVVPRDEDGATGWKKEKRMNMDAHSSGVQFDAPKSTRAPVKRPKRLRMMADTPKKEADALDHWENAVAGPKSILDEAKDIIYGDREKTYGAPDKNLKSIAGYWANHLHTRFGVYHDVTPEDVCIMMTLLKAARLGNDVTHRDSLVDAVGYLALLERIQK